MPLTDHVAIVSLTRDVSTRSLMAVAAAVQKQVTRDFTPLWGLPATVDAFDGLSSVPSDYHPVVIFGHPDELVGRLESALGDQRAEKLIDAFERDRLAGIHLNAFTRQPFALVRASDAWTVTVSHEVLEMIADPHGNRLIAAARLGDDQQRVRYLLEVCDPCQSRWYPVNGVPVSDFYTPRYFDPVQIDGIRYSFTGALRHPLDILDGGYLSWIDPRDSGLYQLAGGEEEPVLLAGLTELANSRAPLRTVVDNSPRTPQVTRQSLKPAPSASASDVPYLAVREASEGAALRVAESVLSLTDNLG